jgi:hypothetical protein
MDGDCAVDRAKREGEGVMDCAWVWSRWPHVELLAMSNNTMDSRNLTRFVLADALPRLAELWLAEYLFSTAWVQV